MCRLIVLRLTVLRHFLLLYIKLGLHSPSCTSFWCACQLASRANLTAGKRQWHAYSVSDTVLKGNHRVLCAVSHCILHVIATGIASSVQGSLHQFVFPDCCTHLEQ